MIRRTLALLALATSMLLASSASARRAVIFRDPGFSHEAPLNGGAFVIWGRIDIQSMVQDFVLAFEGDYAAGEAYARSTLTDCLIGKRAIRAETNSITEGKTTHMNLIDLRATVPNVDVAQDLAATTDSLGVTQLAVSLPDSMNRVLTSAHAKYLIVIHGLRAMRGETDAAPIFLPRANGTGFFMSTAASQRFVSLTGQVFVYRADSMALIWNGFVAGQHEIGRFKKSSVERLVEAFAQDLQSALK